MLTTYVPVRQRRHCDDEVGDNHWQSSVQSFLCHPSCWIMLGKALLKTSFLSLPLAMPFIQATSTQILPAFHILEAQLEQDKHNSFIELCRYIDCIPNCSGRSSWNLSSSINKLWKPISKCLKCQLTFSAFIIDTRGIRRRLKMGRRKVVGCEWPTSSLITGWGHGLWAGTCRWWQHNWCCPTWQRWEASSIWNGNLNHGECLLLNAEDPSSGKPQESTLVKHEDRAEYTILGTINGMVWSNPLSAVLKSLL